MSDIKNWVTPETAPTTVEAMREFLISHPKYWTMAPHNLGKSYARGIKIHWLRYPSSQARSLAHTKLSSAEWQEFLRESLRDFGLEHEMVWQIAQNGRSGGYLVLYQGGRNPSPYQSRCTKCGQQNCLKIVEEPVTATAKLQLFVSQHPHWRYDFYAEQPEVKSLGMSKEAVADVVRKYKASWPDDKPPRVSTSRFCGKCHEMSRVNFATPQFLSFTWPARGTDENEDFSEWDIDDLSRRVELVMDFDRTVDRVIEAFVAYCAGTWNPYGETEDESAGENVSDTAAAQAGQENSVLVDSNELAVLDGEVA